MEQTDCKTVSTEQIEIFQVKSKPVVLSETKTVVSSNAGFLVLGAIDRNMESCLAIKGTESTKDFLFKDQKDLRKRLTPL